MITCKEDLINTYVKNDRGELRDSYLVKCEEYRLKAFNGRSIRSALLDYRHTEYFEVIDSGNGAVIHFTNVSSLSKDSRQLTLYDLKPRTKTVYEKVDFNHAWELVKQFELHNDIFYRSSSAPTYELMSIENIQNMLRNEYPVSLYRKVEKEIDWREEVHNKFQSSGYHWSTPIAEVINDESDCFLDLCRVALRATGELE